MWIDDIMKPQYTEYEVVQAIREIANSKSLRKASLK
jgi:hypothetical protein